MRTGFKWLMSTLVITHLAISPASAHTTVVTTTPIYKSTLTEMPTQISIEFSDELITLKDKKVNSINIEGPDESAVKISKIDIDKNLITASLPKYDYPDGTYRVSYRVVSADGHVVSGSYEIYVNAPTTISNTEDSQDAHHGFFHIHKTHIIWSGIALIVILIWFLYHRHEQDNS